jgi:hypothetical protein
MADEEEKAEPVQVKLNFRIPPRMPSVYAHHMLVQPGEFEVVLSFFEVVAPIVVEKLEPEQLKALQDAGVVAECVAKVTIAKDRFRLFTDALQEVAERLTPVKGTQANADNTRDNPQS